MTVSRRKEPTHYTYLINDQPLPKVREHKYLGITLTSDLKWDTLITALHKLFQYFKRCPRLSPLSTKLLGYTTFARLVLEYEVENTVWFPHLKTNIKILENAQRKAVRLTHNKYKRIDSATKLLVAFGLQTLEARARQAQYLFFKFFIILIKFTSLNVSLIHSHVKANISICIHQQNIPMRSTHLNTYFFHLQYGNGTNQIAI